MIRRRSSIRETSAASGLWPSLGRSRQLTDSVMNIFLLEILTCLIRKETLEAAFTVPLHSHCTSASNVDWSFVRCRATERFPSETSCLVIFCLSSRGRSWHSLVWTASQGSCLLGVLATSVVSAWWRMLCTGVLFCFVPGSCKDALVSLGQDSCVHEANWVLYRVGKFGRAKISSLLVLEGYFCLLLSSDWHEDTPCIQVWLQLVAFSAAWVFHPVFSISLVNPYGVGRCTGASTSTLRWLPGLVSSTVLQPQGCCGNRCHAAPWSHLVGCRCAYGRLQSPVLACA